MGRVLSRDMVKPPAVTGVLHVINDTTEGGREESVQVHELITELPKM